MLRRSQLYLITIFILFILLNSFALSLRSLEREIYAYYNHISNILELYDTRNYNTLYSTLFHLRNKTVIPFVVYYSCSSSSISLKNSFNVKNISVYNQYFKQLPTSSNLLWINFTPSRKVIYKLSKNICVFEGYLCLNCNPNSKNIPGSIPIDVVYNIHSIYNISLWHLYLQNNINDNFRVTFENNTIVYSNNVFSNYLK